MAAIRTMTSGRIISSRSLRASRVFTVTCGAREGRTRRGFCVFLVDVTFREDGVRLEAAVRLAVEVRLEAGARLGVEVRFED